MGVKLLQLPYAVSLCPGHPCPSLALALLQDVSSISSPSLVSASGERQWMGSTQSTPWHRVGESYCNRCG